MRLIDIAFRRGHLSETALVRALLARERPAHIDRCDICGERAKLLLAWLDQLQEVSVAAFDMTFPPERLASQRARILRRLEQLEHVPRVISFPSARRPTRESRDRRVAPVWLGVATAAGVALGVLGGHIMPQWGNVTSPISPTSTSAAQLSSPADMLPDDSVPGAGSGNSIQDPALFGEVDRPSVSSVEALAAMTPRQVNVQLVSLKGPVR